MPNSLKFYIRGWITIFYYAVKYTLYIYYGIIRDLYNSFNLYKYRAFFVFPFVCRIIFWLLIEVKNGDWSWYVSNIGNIPNDHPLTYIILNIINLFTHNSIITVYVAEIIAYYLLFLFLYLTMIEISRYYFNSGDRTIIIICAVLTLYASSLSYIFDGTPLKSTFGLAFFFMFFYFLVKKVKTVRINKYIKYFSLCLLFVTVFLTHIVSSYLILLLIFVYLFRNFKFNRIYITGSEFINNGLIFIIVLLFYYIQTQIVSLWNSGSKILFLSNLSLGILFNNFITVTFSILIIYEIIFVISIFVCLHYRKFDYIDLFLFIICFFLLYCAVPYAIWTFIRFMAIIPFFSILQLSKIIKRVLN